MDEILEEAATVKSSARAAIRALKSIRSNKTVPKSIHDAIDNLDSAFSKTWGDLAADADGEGDGEATSEALHEAATKSEDGKNFTASDYAYVPDPEKSSTWKLRLTSTPGGDPDPAIVGAAAAAFSPGGFRGQRVQLPAGDIAKVKAKLRSAWKKANPDKKDENMPDGIKESEDEYKAWFDALDESERLTFDDHTAGLKSALQKERLRNRNAAQALDGDILESDFVPLLEKAVRHDGTIPIKIIQPGWGSSGYYPKGVLMEDGPKVFTPGLKMYWNHPSATEEKDRPERDLRDLAGVLVSPARWDENGKSGAGLYADAKVFGDYSKHIDELAPHIGVSIRAFGKAKAGEIEGRKGAVIESITGAQSVDFVTTPGAGGKVLELFEAARDGGHQEITTEVTTMDEQANAQLSEMAGKLTASQSEIDRLNEKLVLREARDAVHAALAKSELPKITQDRLAESILLDVPVTEKKELDRDKLNELVEKAVKSEKDYIAGLTKSGEVKGLGDSAPRDEKKLDEAFKNYYKAQGFGEEQAKALAEAGG